MAALVTRLSLDAFSAGGVGEGSRTDRGPPAVPPFPCDRTRGRAPGASSGRPNRLHDPLVDLLDRATAINDDDAVRSDLGDLLVGLSDGALQLDPLGLE